VPGAAGTAAPTGPAFSAGTAKSPARGKGKAKGRGKGKPKGGRNRAPDVRLVEDYGDDSDGGPGGSADVGSASVFGAASSDGFTFATAAPDASEGGGGDQGAGTDRQAAPSWPTTPPAHTAGATVGDRWSGTGTGAAASASTAEPAHMGATTEEESTARPAPRPQSHTADARPKAGTFYPGAGSGSGSGRPTPPGVQEPNAKGSDAEGALRKKEQGNAEYKRGNFRAAARRYTEAIALEENCFYYNNRSLAYFYMGKCVVNANAVRRVPVQTGNLCLILFTGVACPHSRPMGWGP